MIISNLLTLGSIQILAMDRSRSRTPERRILDRTIKYIDLEQANLRMESLHTELLSPAFTSAQKVELCRDFIRELKKDDTNRAHLPEPKSQINLKLIRHLLNKITRLEQI